MFHTNRTLLNDGWRFRLDEGESQMVSLPHTWNALDTMAVAPAVHYRRGVGVYERILSGPAAGRPGQRSFLHFEAAAMTAEVRLDGRFLGRHAGGYTAFEVELPQPAGRLRVAVDNRPDPDLIPSDMSDFFLYGGLTRNVWRYTTGPARLTELHVDSRLTGGAAGLTLRGRGDGPLETAALSLVLRGPAAEIVWEATLPLASDVFALQLPDVPAPQLWSPASPARYTLNARLFCQGELSDEVVEKFGLRTFHFPPGGPFYLNGERLLLRGTHRHEEWAGRGAAVPDRLSRREMGQIRAAGFNFVRLGHYPQSAAVLDACDELGLLVWEELPWCRGGVGGERFKSQARSMLREMIAQHYNHPSIIFWGLGNELDWESEHPQTGDDDVLAFLQELHELAHRFDPSRLTALRRYDRGAAVVDVYSPSIWSGWYRGRYEDYETVLLDALDRFPRLIHAEWGGDSHAGRHGEGSHLKRSIGRHDNHEEIPGVALATSGEARASLDGDWSESYMLDLMEWHLQVQQRLPQLAGTAQWVFKDFGTPLRPENPIPYVNQKGLVTRDGTPKDLYYLFQAYQTDTPVCYIESPTWPLRSGAPGEIKRVRVYTNCERVELRLNGLSQGTKFTTPGVTPAGGMIWFIPFRAGENVLQANGRMADGREVSHIVRQTLVTNGGRQAAAMHGWLDRNGRTSVRVVVQLVNKQGTPVLHDERRLRFSLEGGGSMQVERGTPEGSREIETANGRAAVLIRDPSPGSRCRVTAAGLPSVLISCYPPEHGNA